MIRVVHFRHSNAIPSALNIKRYLTEPSSKLIRYSPGSSHHRQRDGQANTQIGPHERRGLCQEPVREEGSTADEYST